MARREEILARCLADLERGRGLEECLARYPEWREELEPLLRAADRLRSAPDVTLSPTFREHARERLLRKIETRTPRTEGERELGKGLASALRDWLRLPVQLRQATRPVLVAVGILVLLAAASAGVAYASSDSLPGDALYPVKRTVERTRLALAQDAASRTRRHLEFADERLDEAQRLTRLQRTAEIETAMEGYSAAVTAASDALGTGQAAGQDAARLARHLREQVARQQRALRQIRKEAGAGLQPAVERALAASEEARQRASKAIPAQPDKPPSSEKPPSPTTAATDTRLAPTESPTSAGQPAGDGPPTTTSVPPGQTRSPEPPGQTKPAQVPGQLDTSEPPARTETPDGPEPSDTPDPPRTGPTPSPVEETAAPEPWEESPTHQPPGQTKTPEPPGQTMTPQPPGQTRTPGKP